MRRKIERVYSNTQSILFNKCGSPYRRGSPLNLSQVATIRECLHAHGGVIERVVQELGHSWKTVAKYGGEYYERGQRGRSPWKMTDTVVAFIEHCLIQNPMLYGHELQSLIIENFNVDISVSWIMYVRNHKLGWRRKRAQIISIARKDPRVILHRSSFRETIRDISKFRLAFMDESHFQSNDEVRPFGVGKGGNIVRNVSQPKRNFKYSLFCGIWKGKVVYHRWLHVSEQGETSTAPRFISFMRALSARLPHEVIILLDNAKIHRVEESMDFFKLLPQCVVFLSPYSPDYNPIEYVFGLLKLKLKNYKGDKMHLTDIVDEILENITTEQIMSFIQHCHNVIQHDDDPI